MPWTAKPSYMAHTKVELKEMLKRRKLPCAGNKTQMSARLNDYDDTHPFRFLDLPGEIRNLIYEYVAKCPLTSRDPHVESILSKNVELWRSVKLHSSPELMAVQPGLLAVCKSIREEGLVLYYQHHHFSCKFINPMPRISIFNLLLRWVRITGDLGSRNIRHLDLDGNSESF